MFGCVLAGCCGRERAQPKDEVCGGRIRSGGEDRMRSCWRQRRYCCMFLFPLSCGADTENGPSAERETEEQTVHLDLCDDMLAGEG